MLSVYDRTDDICIGKYLYTLTNDKAMGFYLFQLCTGILSCMLFSVLEYRICLCIVLWAELVFCCVLLWFGGCRFYPHPPCLLHCNWGNRETALRWRHNGRDTVSNHQPHDCLLNRLFRRRSKKTSKLRVTGLCAGNSPGTGEFPAQMASNAENVSIWRRHHGLNSSD